MTPALAVVTDIERPTKMETLSERIRRLQAEAGAAPASAGG